MGFSRSMGFAARQQFHEAAQDFIAIIAFQGKRELGGEQAVLETDVVTAALEVTGEVMLARDQSGERRGEVEAALRSGPSDFLGQNFRDARSQHMHAKETKVMPYAQSGDDELLLGDGGGRFFNDLRNFIKTFAPRDQPAA